jgi:hypothetical protein
MTLQNVAKFAFIARKKIGCISVCLGETLSGRQATVGLIREPCKVGAEHVRHRIRVGCDVLLRPLGLGETAPFPPQRRLDEVGGERDREVEASMQFFRAFSFIAQVAVLAACESDACLKGCASACHSCNTLPKKNQRCK